tara:strand:+ start:365 stop:589 length:225 start_codon:yes stop_codon:yes gene_type:complete
MPTKTKEVYLYAPGSLVKTRKELYSYDPHEMIQAGTVGIVLSGPKENYNHHLQVQFTGMESPWWVNYSEIEPHL